MLPTKTGRFARGIFGKILIGLGGVSGLTAANNAERGTKMENQIIKNDSERELMQELRKNWRLYLQSATMRSTEYERLQRLTLEKYSRMEKLNN
jgi:hypothetical protein